jgi:hypothetical protein
MIEKLLAQFLDSTFEFSVDPALIDKIKTVSGIVSLALAFLFVLILYKFSALRIKKDGTSVAQELAQDISPPAPAPGGAYKARWEEIVKHMDSTRETEWKFAVIEADKLMDLVLKRAGFPGDTLGERLMNIQPGQLENLQGLWDAHKVRNRLAHEVDYFLRYSEAKQAIGQYEAFLRELEAI